MFFSKSFEKDDRERGKGGGERKRDREGFFRGRKKGWMNE